jgi:hypothetical protein
MLCHVSAVWSGARSSGCGWSGSSTWPSRRLSTNTTTAGNARATDGRAWLRRRPSERIERTLYSPILEQGAILQVRLPLLENLGAIEGIRGDISKKHTWLSFISLSSLDMTDAQGRGEDARSSRRRPDSQWFEGRRRQKTFYA